MRFYSASFFAAALTVASSANADVLCTNQDKTVKIETFQLSEDTFGLEPIKVAAILKVSDIKALYTGSEQTLPSRTGRTNVFSLTNEQGNAIEFQTTASLIYDQCTRVSCEPILKIVAILEVLGATYNLNCTAPVF